MENGTRPIVKTIHTVAREIAIYGSFLGIVGGLIWIGRTYEKHENRYKDHENRILQVEKDVSDHSVYINSLNVRWAAHTGQTITK